MAGKGQVASQEPMTCQENGYLWTNVIPLADLATPAVFLCFHKGKLYQWYNYISMQITDHIRPPTSGLWVAVPTL